MRFYGEPIVEFSLINSLLNNINNVQSIIEEEKKYDLTKRKRNKSCPHFKVDSKRKLNNTKIKAGINKKIQNKKKK